MCIRKMHVFVHLISKGESWTVITSDDSDQYTRTAKYMFSGRTGVSDQLIIEGAPPSLILIPDTWL